MQYVLFDNYQASLVGEYFWLKMRALCLQKNGIIAVLWAVAAVAGEDTGPRNRPGSSSSINPFSLLALCETLPSFLILLIQRTDISDVNG